MPVLPKSKYPALNEWKKYQTEKYIGDFDPNQNGAVLCGISSGNLVVIDLDNKELIKVFDDWEKIKKETLVVETGKGYHVYIKPKGKLPEISIRTINEVGQRIDIQSHGTYVLIAGSIHPDTGKEYKIISSTLDVKEIDLDGFINGLSKHGFNAEIRRKRMVEVLKGVGEGERNDSGFRLAMCARHFWDLRDTELLEMLEHWNQTKVFPPMSDLEIKNIVRSAMNYNIDDIKFKDVLEQVEKTFEYKIKYDDYFWGNISDFCKKNNIKSPLLKFKCEICKTLMSNNPQDKTHKGHMITIIYK